MQSRKIIIHCEGHIVKSTSPNVDGSNPKLVLIEEDDFQAILACFDPNYEVVIEDGMTVMEFVTALSPWSDVFFTICGVDLRAWIRSYSRGHTDPDGSVGKVVVTASFHDDETTGLRYRHMSLRGIKSDFVPDVIDNIDVAKPSTYGDLPFGVYAFAVDGREEPTDSRVTGLNFYEVVVDGFLGELLGVAFETEE